VVDQYDRKLTWGALCRAGVFSCTGYLQGMSDLLAPFVAVMETEADAFWCFAGFMEQRVWALTPSRCAEPGQAGSQL